jgi:thiamine-phosphate pyrophosphorylase
MNQANPALLRIIDANCNRTREGLRVVEEHARFALDDAELSASLKQLRHDFESATRSLAARAVVYRDTPGDVGTMIATASEKTRGSGADVARANASRAGEALRVVEEYAKPVDPTCAAAVEAVRYRFYELERRLNARLRPASRLASVRLMVIVTESVCHGAWLDAARQALLGGAGCLQLREKSLDGRQLLERARLFVALCREHQALAVINDRPDIALLSGADGVHVGQGDLPAREARKIVGTDAIVGVSTHSIEDARRAHDDGADYIGVGPVYRSSTKPRDFVVGVEGAKQIVASTDLPAFAIAGIDAGNANAVMSTGCAGIAVSSAVLTSDDPGRSARELIDAISDRSGQHVRTDGGS